MRKLLLLMVTLATLAAAVANAQDRDRDRDRDRGERRGFDPKQWIEGMDANKNGVIEPGEMSERSSRFLQRAADQAGLKAGEPWPVEKLLGAMSRRDDNNNSNASNSSSSEHRSGEPSRTDGSPMSTITTPASTTSVPASTGSSSGSSLPKVPILGFGEKDGGIKIPTFAPAPLGGVAPVATGSSSTTQYDERIVSRVNDMLKEADSNRNGYLDPDEIKAYRNWSTPPEESDLDKDGRLSRAELLERIAKRYSRGSRSDSSSRGSSSQSVDTAAQSRKYAEGLVQKYDANKSGYLEKDEWKELKPEYQAADVNKDGVISTDELVAKLNALNSGQGGSSSSSSGPSSGGSGYSRYGSRSDRDRDRNGKPGEKDSKKPLVRALTPTERLPKGLPDWFLRNDADADGQVSMVEYAAAWSEKTAAEFQKYDLNQDGIITASEVLTVDKDSKSTTRSR